MRFPQRFNTLVAAQPFAKIYHVLPESLSYLSVTSFTAAFLEGNFGAVAGLCIEM